MNNKYPDQEGQSQNQDFFSSTANNKRNPRGLLFNERTFWDKWYEDISLANKSILIVSPFLSFDTISKFLDRLIEARERGADLLIACRPREQQYNHFNRQGFELLQRERIHVAPRADIHQKLCIIDKRIAWEGSLNITCHQGSRDFMRRHEGVDAVEEVIQVNRLYFRH